MACKQIRNILVVLRFHGGEGGIRKICLRRIFREQLKKKKKIAGHPSRARRYWIGKALQLSPFQWLL